MPKLLFPADAPPRPPSQGVVQRVKEAQAHAGSGGLGLAMLFALATIPTAALATNQSVVSIESEFGAWRLTCAWEGKTAVDWRGQGDKSFEFPPGRLNCIIAIEHRGALRVEAVGADGSESSIQLEGYGRARFSLR